MTGEWPDGPLTYRDNNKFNLRWTNIVPCNDTSAYPRGNNPTKGVYLTKHNSYLSIIYHKKKSVYVGCFTTEEAARVAYEKKYRELKGGTNHTGASQGSGDVSPQVG